MHKYSLYVISIHLLNIYKNLICKRQSGNHKINKNILIYNYKN